MLCCTICPPSSWSPPNRIRTRYLLESAIAPQSWHCDMTECPLAPHSQKFPCPTKPLIIFRLLLPAGYTTLDCMCNTNKLKNLLCLVLSVSQIEGETFCAACRCNMIQVVYVVYRMYQLSRFVLYPSGFRIVPSLPLIHFLESVACCSLR
mmetsp:Transcript_34380/g.79359  ORF Transcript_34380/g.79359 Transcript_34380/m.79359 type:complete len:150 (-) Transcript_34380:348-797(-)